MWQGDNQTTAASIFLVYNPKGRPVLLHGATSQQIGSYNSGRLGEYHLQPCGECREPAR